MMTYFDSCMATTWEDSSHQVSIREEYLLRGIRNQYFQATRQIFEVTYRAQTDFDIEYKQNGRQEVDVGTRLARLAALQPRDRL